MIIWINGPFGVGKTTLAKSLAARLKGSLILDPEHIGFLLRGSDDFQDIKLWRTLTGFAGGIFGKYLTGQLIVPMTVTSPSYLSEIFVRVSARGVPIRHFYLELCSAELRQRIEADKKRILRDGKVRGWRLSQLERCLTAKAEMPKETIYLSAAKPVEQLLEEIHLLL